MEIEILKQKEFFDSEIVKKFCEEYFPFDENDSLERKKEKWEKSLILHGSRLSIQKAEARYRLFFLVLILTVLLIAALLRIG